MTPLKVAGELNEMNKKVKSSANRQIVRKTNNTRRLWKMYKRSFNSVRCTAGYLYTFENTIVLCCFNNCIQLTLNLLVTFKGQ